MLQRVRIGTHHRTTQAKKDIAVSVVVPIVLVMLVIVFSLLKPASFFTIGNFQTVLTGQAVLLMVALCLTVVLAAGDLDLSIGGLIGFSGVMFGYLTAIHHFPWGIGLLVSVALGIIIGLINAMLIVGLGVNSLITTLAMGTLLNGVSSAVSKSETIGGLPYVMSSIVDKKFLGIGIAFWYSIIIGFILWYVLHHTRTGRYIYFTGEGREAAKLAGVRTNKIRAAETALRRAVFCGLPVVKCGRGNTEGVASNQEPWFIRGNDLTATKARILLMACLLRYGSLPPAVDPTKPDIHERQATIKAVKQFQTIFDTH